MSYLTPNGVTTEFLLEHIVNVLKLHFNLSDTSVPFNMNLGLNLDIKKVDRSAYRSELESSLNELLDRMNTEFAINLKVEELKDESTNFVFSISLEGRELIKDFRL